VESPHPPPYLIPAHWVELCQLSTSFFLCILVFAPLIGCSDAVTSQKPPINFNLLCLPAAATHPDRNSYRSSFPRYRKCTRVLDSRTSMIQCDREVSRIAGECGRAKEIFARMRALARILDVLRTELPEVTLSEYPDLMDWERPQITSMDAVASPPTHHFTSSYHLQHAVSSEDLFEVNRRLELLEARDRATTQRGVIADVYVHSLRLQLQRTLKQKLSFFQRLAGLPDSVRQASDPHFGL
jgi:hypothetical protein